MKQCKGCSRKFNPSTSPYKDYGSTCGKKNGGELSVPQGEIKSHSLDFTSNNEMFIKIRVDGKEIEINTHKKKVKYSIQLEAYLKEQIKHHKTQYGVNADFLEDIQNDLRNAIAKESERFVDKEKEVFDYPYFSNEVKKEMCVNMIGNITNEDGSDDEDPDMPVFLIQEVINNPCFNKQEKAMYVGESILSALKCKGLTKKHLLEAKAHLENRIKEENGDRWEPDWLSENLSILNKNLNRFN